ncbi:MAG TPA: efflux RND transporter periplasmic adaptor subunit [Urbifossiella sp.]|nr:efflux RND transporter periplasmic adaptor subunit [Urbifossiella sp.]
MTHDSVNDLLSRPRQGSELPARRRLRPLTGPARVLLLTLLLVFPGCAPKAADTGARADAAPVAVTVEPVKAVTLPRTVSVVGTLDPYREVTLAPKVDGRVLRVRRDIGDSVYPGEALLELDDHDYRLDVEIARRGLEAELARLELEAVPGAGADVAKLIEAVPAVARAKAGAEEAARKVEQQTNLVEKGGGAREDVAVVAAERKVADAVLRQVQTEARSAIVNARKLQATLEQSEQRLRDTVVRAPVTDEWAAWAAALGPAVPFRYVVAQRFVWEGEMVRSMPEKNLFRLVVCHPLKLRAAVPEKHAPEVRMGQPAAVRVEAFDRPFRGVVRRVAPTVDAQNRTFGVEVDVPNNDPAAPLKPGSFARAEVETRTDENVLTVPPAALVTFAGVTKVFVADGDKAKAVPVRVGRRDRDWVEVSGALAAGARVITSGQTQLVDGSAIRVRE